MIVTSRKYPKSYNFSRESTGLVALISADHGNEVSKPAWDDLGESQSGILSGRTGFNINGLDIRCLDGWDFGLSRKKEEGELTVDIAFGKTALWRTNRAVGHSFPQTVHTRLSEWPIDNLGRHIIPSGTELHSKCLQIVTPRFRYCSLIGLL